MTEKIKILTEALELCSMDYRYDIQMTAMDFCIAFLKAKGKYNE
jgi:hypothetical protein